jgi:hypothetical protein
MKSVSSLLAIVLAASSVTVGDEAEPRVTTVARIKGLISFWDFSLMQEGRHRERWARNTNCQVPMGASI